MLVSVILVVIFCLHSSSGNGYEYKLASSVNSITRSKIFQKTIYKGKQIEIMESIIGGTHLGIDHCKKQFQWERWNCPDSDFSRQSWRSTMTREAAFSAAIVAAGITYSITKNCTQGLIPECQCNNRFYKSESNKGEWIMEGCSDDTNFSTHLTRKLLESLYKDKNDDITKASLHNHNIGIFAVQNTVKLSCKCHGVSGSCNVKSCWKQLAPFQEIASFLKKRYLKAQRIKQNSAKQIGWTKVPKRKMIYLTDSPNYCKINNTTGWMGTSGRVCHQTHTGELKYLDINNCNKLCESCGHNIRHKSRIHKWQCNCKFHWCCKVTCETCSSIVEESYCEATRESL